MASTSPRRTLDAETSTVEPSADSTHSIKQSENDDGEAITTPKNSPSRNVESSGSAERSTTTAAATMAPSPEPNCAICLGKLENKSFTDSCFHQFCFTCLLEWSKVKAECPLCKQSFKSIVHNVRSFEDYDQYHLQTVESFGNWDTGGEGFSGGGMGGRRFRYRSTLTAERRREMALGRLLLGHRLPPPLSSLSGRNAPSPPPPPARLSPYTTSEFRRYIYENDLWAKSSCRASRYREAAPNFYTTNPAVTHRLVPWLNRELNALRYGHQVSYLLELIMSLIERFHIRSPEFREHIRPYFLNEADHFVHEFFNFARSPHDMVEYDRLVTYGPSSPSSNDGATAAAITASSSSSSASNRFSSPDVMVVYSSEDASRNRELAGHQPIVLTRARLFLDLVSPSRTPRNLEPIVLTSRSGSPVPGPSGIQASRRTVKQEVTIEDDDDDDDDDCMVVEVVKTSKPKPPQIIIDLSNDDVINDDDNDDNDDDDYASSSSVLIPDSDAPSTSTLKRPLMSSSNADTDSDNDDDDDSTMRSSSSDRTAPKTEASSVAVVKSELPSTAASTSSSSSRPRHEPRSHKDHKSKHRHHHHHHHHRKHKSHSRSKSSRREHRHRSSATDSPSLERHRKEKGKSEKS